jgi:hypothetical protein
MAPIVKTILFAGRNNLPLRGHRDSGRLNVTTADDEAGEGLFRALLKFRVDAGDGKLRDMLENAPRNAQYISSVVQNELITSIGDLITAKIVTEVKEAGMFSVLVDETADVSQREQVSLTFRIVSKEGEVVELFAGFVTTEALTGKGLAQVVKDFLTKLRLDLGMCRGQGYDGAAAMSGRMNGCQAVILEAQPLASFVHCASHRLNLAISDTCNVTEFKVAFGTLSSVSNFILGSPQRIAHFEREVESAFSGDEVAPKRRRLLTLCATRWVERHDAVLVFCELFVAVINHLSYYEREGDATVAAAAGCLNCAIRKPAFLVALAVAEWGLGKTVGLSKALQDPKLHLGSALDSVATLRRDFEAARCDAKEVFLSVFQRSMELAQVADVELLPPRRVGRQLHRANFASEAPADYFRVCFFIPFLEHITTQLKLRFQKTPPQIVLQELLPSHAVYPASKERVMHVAKLHAVDINAPEREVEAQVDAWVKWAAGVCGEEQNTSYMDCVDAWLILCFALMLRSSCACSRLSPS